MSLPVGARIADRYVVRGVIAQGGMGAVLDAHDEKLARPVAIKVLLRELASDAVSVARFEREARIAARVSHPGLVQVLDSGTVADGSSFLVMERIAGSTLSQVLGAGGRLAPARAADLAEQALGALSAAHAAGIVHRDLKPGNLMVVPLGGDGRELVKVLDFGIAQLKTSSSYARLTQTGAILGTPTFMAPEQAQGGAVDARADVYAMGLVLWCLLTGRRPFEGRDMASVLEQVLSVVPPRADQLAPVPAELAAIAETAMQKPPASRYPDAAAFASALARWRQRGLVEPTEPAPAARPGERGLRPVASAAASAEAVPAPATQTLAVPAGSPSEAQTRALPGAGLPPEAQTPAVPAGSPPEAQATTVLPGAGLPPIAVPAGPLPATSTPARTARLAWWLALVSALAIALVAGATLLAVAGFVLATRRTVQVAPAPAGAPAPTAAPSEADPVCAATAACCRRSVRSSRSAAYDAACDHWRSLPPTEANERLCRDSFAQYVQSVVVQGGSAAECGPAP